MIALLSLYADLAVGLVMLFLLMSLLVSGLNEAFVRLLSIRSKFLWAYLRDTMDGSDEQGKSWLPAKVRDVFAALPFQRDPRPEFSDQPAPSDAAPAPTAAEEAPAPMTERLYERVQEIDHPRTGRTSIANIPPERFAVAVVEMAAAEPEGVEGLLGKLQELKSPLHGHLKGVWEGAQRDMDRFRQGVEIWFDAEMQRLSMLYKRYVKWVVAVLGLLITLIFSLDGVEFAKSVLRDNGYRAAVAAAASGGPEVVEQLKVKCTQPGESSDLAGCITETLSSPALIQALGNAVVSVSVPAEGDPSVQWNGGAWWDRLTTWTHWPGFLLTYVALLFGAPFWWDILRRITGFKRS
ncbi:hypothetical protein [Nonomuraea soli]|uniref:Uncharacterized protein n=1 Tax=Nonomuraea soli TaxID=1032476 RepID=A0A7W0CE06_9ACTN|nr:hypothetical protein [Nonomuraea soli]MBA2889399.1 hypothetical protein [Nonomuraea soli]